MSDSKGPQRDTRCRPSGHRRGYVVHAGDWGDCAELVFAESPGKAKRRATGMDQYDWTELRVKRAPWADRYADVGYCDTCGLHTWESVPASHLCERCDDHVCLSCCDCPDPTHPDDTPTSAADQERSS